MSVHAGARVLSMAAVPDAERRHRLRLRIAWIVAALLLLSLAAYGHNYYTLSAAERPHSDKHHLLRPSGTLGMKLGMFGCLLFLGIYLYPIRKRWPWLARQGSARHWLDFHVVLGLTAPVIIAFHSSFKFQGVAGMAFWTMTAVAVSGLVGRYLYAQIPRSLSAAEVSMKELKEKHGEFTELLTEQRVLRERELEALFQLPSAAIVQSMSLPAALGSMIALDLKRPFRVAALRWRSIGLADRVFTLGGLLRSSDRRLEGAIRLARRQAMLSKKILFLARAQRVFQLWHVVHRPFSYAFVVLASIHIGVVLLLGYM